MSSSSRHLNARRLPSRALFVFFPATFVITWGIVGSKPELVPKPAFFAYQRVIPETAIDEAVVLEMQSPGLVPPGQRAEIVVSVRNDGTNPWTGSTGYRLDVAVDADEWLLDADSIEQITEIQLIVIDVLRWLIHVDFFGCACH